MKLKSFGTFVQMPFLGLNPVAFRKNSNEVFRELNEWFQGNLLLLNCDKTYFLPFVSKKNEPIPTYLLETSTLIISIVPDS